jgi:phage gpG-like protein
MTKLGPFDAFDTYWETVKHMEVASGVCGSGTVVGRTSEGNAIVLTNAHVAGTQRGRTVNVERWNVIVVKITIKKSIHQVQRKAQQGNFKSLGHAAAALRLVARRSIRRRRMAASPGSPPNTRRGQLKRSIMYAVNKKRGVALIGPSFEMVGTAGKAHEFGGRYRRERYPKRPFMGPALDKVKDRLPSMWAGSIR